MMSENLKDILSRTLEDRRISRTEKKALRQVLEDFQQREDPLESFRKEAFKLAKKALQNSRDKEILEWLEEVLRLASHQSPQPIEVRASFSPGETCQKEILSLIKTCNSTLYICVFTITDNVISEVILEAHRRGVSVRIISDDLKSEDLGSDIEKFQKAGIPVKMDHSPLHMHHKFAIFDRTTVLSGSYNWTRGALEQQENILITDHPGAVSQYLHEFERLWEGL